MRSILLRKSRGKYKIGTIKANIKLINNIKHISTFENENPSITNKFNNIPFSSNNTNKYNNNLFVEYLND